MAFPPRSVKGSPTPQTSLNRLDLRGLCQAETPPLHHGVFATRQGTRGIASTRRSVARCPGLERIRPGDPLSTICP